MKPKKFYFKFMGKKFRTFLEAVQAEKKYRNQTGIFVEIKQIPRRKN